MVDESGDVRENLRDVLEARDFQVDTHPSAESLLDSRALSDFGCVLLEVRLPGMNGLELQRRLTELHSELPLIFLANGGVDVRTAVEAMKGGAFDFIEKPYELEFLLKRIREAVARSLRDRDEKQLRSALTSRLSSLTPRERQILNLVVSGMTNKAIGNREAISIKTVENHRARIMKKMKAASLAELVRMVMSCS